MICSKTFLWSLQNSDLSSQQFGIILAKPLCPCVQTPLSIFHSTGQVSLDQWEVANLCYWPIRAEKYPFDNCMGWAMTAVTGVSSELNSNPFPAWSSHSLLVTLSQYFWPMRGADSEPLTNQRTGNLTQTGLEMTFAMFTAEWALATCSEDAAVSAGPASWNMFVSFLAALRAE